MRATLVVILFAVLCQTHCRTLGGYSTYSTPPPLPDTTTDSENYDDDGEPIKSTEKGYYYIPPTQTQQPLAVDYTVTPSVLQPAYGAPKAQPAAVAPAPIQSYGAPQQVKAAYGAPQQLQQQYGTPQQLQRPIVAYAPAPQQVNYGAPAKSAQTNYGAPVKQLQTSYGAPQVRQPVQAYGAPQQPQQQQQQVYIAQDYQAQAQPKQQLVQSYGAPAQVQQTTPTYVAPSTFYAVGPTPQAQKLQTAPLYSAPQKQKQASQSYGAPLLAVSYGVPIQSQPPRAAYGAPKQQQQQQQQQPSRAYGSPPALSLTVPTGYATQGGYGGASSAPSSAANPLLLPASQAEVFNSVTPNSPDMFFFSQKDKVLYKVSRLPVNGNVGTELNSLAANYGLQGSPDYIPLNLPQSGAAGGSGSDSDSTGNSDATTTTTTPAPAAVAAQPSSPAGPGYAIEFEIEEETEGDPGTENQNPNLTPVAGGAAPAPIPSGDGSGQATEQLSQLALPSHLQEELETLLRNPSVGPELQRQLSELVRQEELRGRGGANEVVPSSNIPENLDAATGTPGQAQRRVRKRMNFKAGGAIG